MPSAPGATTSMEPSSLSTPTTPPSATFPHSPSSLVDRLVGWSCCRNTTLTSSTSEELTTSSRTPSLDDQTTVTLTPSSCTTSVSPCHRTSATSSSRTTTMILDLDPSTRIVWMERSPTDIYSRTTSFTLPDVEQPPWPSLDDPQSASLSCTTPMTLPLLDTLAFRRPTTTCAVSYTGLTSPRIPSSM